jgi:D-proline reductase (dithiol) PrdB
MPPVDSFKYLPRLIALFYQSNQREPQLPIPWTALKKPVAESKFGLITSGGVYDRSRQQPFDLDRERREPRWGDPSFRTIPITIPTEDLGVSHLHVNPDDILEDIDILLPIHRFQELATAGVIGGVAQDAISFMGYQGFPPNTDEWEKTYAPQVAELFKAEDVDCILLTPS